MLKLKVRRQFFTREWATGALSDEEYESVPKRYADHVAGLDLPESVLALANASLHDGLVQRIVKGPGVLSLLLITGDQQQGYQDTTVTYSEPLTWGASVAFLESVAGKADTEVLEHEVDRLDHRFIHRILFSTDDEIEIVFTSVSVKQRPRDSRTFGPSPGV